MCASLQFRVTERPEKYLLSARRRELYAPGPLKHFLLLNKQYIHTESSGL